MSAIRHLMRAATVAGIALTGTIIAAGPVHAADAACQLGRPSSRLTAGSGSSPLVAHIRSSDNREVLPLVEVVWRLRLNGLNADEVTISGLSLNQVDNELHATEELRNVNAFGRTTTHTLRFLAGAPSGRATITMAALLPDGDGEAKEACSSRATITVQAARGTPTPTRTTGPATPEPDPTDTPANRISETPVGAAVAPPPPDQDAALWPLYVLGLLLVAGGGGIVALLLLRRPRRDEAEPGYVSGYGHGPQPAGAVYGGAAYSGGGGGYVRPAGGSLYGGASGAGYGGTPGANVPAANVPGGQDGGAAAWPAYGGTAGGYGAQPMGAPQDPWPAAGAYGPAAEPTAPMVPETPTTIIPKIDDAPHNEDRRPGGWHRDGGR
jgi:hypothetical protein